MLAIFSFLLVFQAPPPLSVQLPQGTVYQLPTDSQDGNDQLQLGTIQLGEKSTLVLSSFKSVHIKEIIAKNGSKILFPSNTSGADGGPSVNGGDAGPVEIFTDKIDGHVLIEARGGNGGDGLDGRDGQQGVDGRKGQNGIRLFWFYLSDGKQGQKGGPGENGEDGENGGNGGNGGIVKVFYKEKTPDSDIVVDVSAGSAGKGGREGRGGLGGNGGPGGYGIHRGPQGRMGAYGKNGRPGRPGEPGKAGSVSIYQVSARLYSCLVEFYAIKHQVNEGDWRQCVLRD